jgi:hypothetical protein
MWPFGERWENRVYGFELKRELSLFRMVEVSWVDVLLSVWGGGMITRALLLRLLLAVHRQCRDHRHGLHGRRRSRAVELRLVHTDMWVWDLNIQLCVRRASVSNSYNKQARHEKEESKGKTHTHIPRLPQLYNLNPFHLSPPFIPLPNPLLQRS